MRQLLLISLLSLCSVLSYSQGTRGRLLFKEDFGGYSDSDPVISITPLPPGVTDYIFVSTNTQPQANRYMLAKRVTNNMAFGTWFSGANSYTDHTYPDSGEKGYMMIVNADEEAGLFYKYQIDNLCTNSRLIFSAWVGNLVKQGTTHLDPKLRFVLEDALSGEVLLEHETGEIPKRNLPVWQYEEAVFYNNESSSIIMYIYNDQPGSYGNDLVLDDIEIRLDVPDISLQGPIQYCSDESMDLSIQFDDNGVFGNDPQILWFYSTDPDEELENWSLINVGENYRDTFTAGYYCIIVGTKSNTDSKNYNCCSVSDKYLISQTPLEVYWKKDALNNNWNDPANWVDVDGVDLNATPRICTDVHIPGNASKYPSLDPIYTPREERGVPVCNDIYFHFGGELAQPNHLVYNKAHIRYNFGYYDNANNYRTDGDTHSDNYMRRDRWYALSTPLKKVVTGDFSFGGKPHTWQKAFHRNESNGNFIGEWFTPSNDNALHLDEKQAYAITLWVNKHEAGMIGSGEGYQDGINNLKGIVQLPYFENDEHSTHHRIHSYNGTHCEFRYYYYDRPNVPLAPNLPGKITRGEEAYRFIFDNNIVQVPDGIDAGKDAFKITVSSNSEVMIGNPFLSCLDFNKFYEANSTNLKPFYRLYSDGLWNEYTYQLGTGVAGLDTYIAPLQAFFVVTEDTGNAEIDLYFPFETTSVVRPANEEYRLRTKSAVHNANTLHITASNKQGNSSIILALDDYDAENIYKLFYAYSESPQVYFTDSVKNKNAIQYNQANYFETEFGLYHTKKGDSIELSFAGLDAFPLELLILFDREEQKAQNLLSYHTYRFLTTKSGYLDRFLLIGKKQIQQDEETFSEEYPVLVSVLGNQLLINSGCELECIRIFNTGGILLYLNDNCNSMSSTIDISNYPKGVYIVYTQQEGKSSIAHKIIVH